MDIENGKVNNSFNTSPQITLSWEGINAFAPIKAGCCKKSTENKQILHNSEKDAFKFYIYAKTII